MDRISLNVLIVGIVAFACIGIKMRAIQERAVETPNVTAQVPSRAAQLFISKPMLPEAKPEAPASKVTDTSAAASPLITAEKPAPTNVDAELIFFSNLKRKPVLTAAEEQHRDRLLKSAKLLRALKSHLMHSPTSPEEALEQNAAIDMLLAALRTGDSETATDVLRAVVTDGQVEDPDLEPSSRENLAGVKAEVLFQWSALNPGETEELANLMPGPVSQKIWENVVDAQQSSSSNTAALDH